MTRSATEDGYVLPRTEAEYARLRMQAKAWEPVTLTLLQDAGLAPGMSCLDAGCGPGEAMRLMGRIVGPEGHVTGSTSTRPSARTCWRSSAARRARSSTSRAAT